MILSPNYSATPLLTIDDSTEDLAVAIMRQHRRLIELATELDDRMWATPSRCDGWTVRDVIAHLGGVNNFWSMSIQGGVAGQPTRMLAGFDPAETPPLLVEAMSHDSNEQVLSKFVAASEMLVAALADLDGDGWCSIAESPAGHVPIRVVAHHALWDSWVHERDIALPLGLDPVEEPDEVAICLRYAAVLSPTLALGFGQAVAGRFAVDATDQDVRFVIDITDVVSLDSTSPTNDLPCLRGGAVALTEALSLRTAMPHDAPDEWRKVLAGLRTAFDSE